MREREKILEGEMYRVRKWREIVIFVPISCHNVLKPLSSTFTSQHITQKKQQQLITYRRIESFYLFHDPHHNCLLDSGATALMGNFISTLEPLLSLGLSFIHWELLSIGL
jgi:hypothetical protein